jgi:hypothetical protein
VNTYIYIYCSFVYFHCPVQTVFTSASHGGVITGEADDIGILTLWPMRCPIFSTNGRARLLETQFRRFSRQLFLMFSTPGRRASSLPRVVHLFTVDFRFLTPVQDFYHKCFTQLGECFSSGKDWRYAGCGLVGCFPPLPILECPEDKADMFLMTDEKR